MSLGGARRHFGLLHQLQQVRLHAAPADIPARMVAGGGDLVDFVNVNDAVLRPRHVAVRQPHQVAHHVLDIAADVAGFRELRRVRLHKRHADQFRRAADEVGFADAGGADENDVLLGVIGGLLAFQRQPHVVVMIAQGHAQHFLRLVLFDDEPVEVFLHLARLVVELELVCLLPRCVRLRCAGVLGLG